MRHLSAAATLLLLLSITAAPVVTQGIPDHIPDEPGESLIDREKERQTERYRGFLNRFFSVSGVAVAPLTQHGLGYTAEAGVGMYLRSGDALLLTVGTRMFPDRDRFSAPGEDGLLGAGTEFHAAFGYELAGTRLLGESSDLARRAALRMGVGVLVAEARAMTAEVIPSYELFQGQFRGHAWSVPVGPRLTFALIHRIDDADVTLARTFLGLQAGFRWQFMGRERMN